MVNADGGINGKKVAAKIVDDGSDPAKASSLIKGLIDDGVGRHRRFGREHHRGGMAPDRGSRRRARHRWRVLLGRRQLRRELLLCHDDRDPRRSEGPGEVGGRSGWRRLRHHVRVRHPRRRRGRRVVQGAGRGRRHDLDRSRRHDQHAARLHGSVRHVQAGQHHRRRHRGRAVAAEHGTRLRSSELLPEVHVG